MSKLRITQETDDDSSLSQSLAEEHNDFDEEESLHATEGEVPKSEHTGEI
jgi:hypothetical protein